MNQATGDATIADAICDRVVHESSPWSAVESVTVKPETPLEGIEGAASEAEAFLGSRFSFAGARR